MGRRLVRLDAARALRSAVEFLIASSFSTDGAEAWWQDFDLYPGPSDEWVTAYAGCALAGAPGGRAHRWAAKAWRWLKNRASGRSAGFRYNGRTTPDADSTAWACRLAVGLGISGGPLDGALGFLESCRRRDGGIATYPSREAVRAAIRIPADLPVDGWASSHVCVTAAAAGIPKFGDDERVRRFLRREQMRSGEWRGYWWCDAEYATAMAIECLAHSATAPDRRAAGLGIEYLRTSGGGDSAFRLALRIIGLSRGGEPPADLLGQLTALQQTDGSWPPSARLRIPPPDEMSPDRRWNWDEGYKGFGSIRLDANRIFTTATAVRALSAAAAP